MSAHGIMIADERQIGGSQGQGTLKAEQGF